MIITTKNRLKNFTNDSSIVFYAGFDATVTLQDINFIDITLIRQNFFKIIKKLLMNLDVFLKNQNIDRLWLASDLAENNLCLEKFTPFIVNTLIAKDLIINKKISLILCDDDEQVWIYEMLLRSNGLKIDAIFSKWRILKKYLGFFKEKIKYTLLSILKKSYTYFNFHVTAKKRQDIYHTEMVIINWFDQFSLQGNKLIENDRYFGNLIGFIKEKKRLIVLARPTNHSFKIFREIDKNISHFKDSFSCFHTNDFLSYFDIIKSFFISFTILKFWNRNFHIQGTDFSHLWNIFCLTDALKPRIPHALETFYATKNCLKKTLDKNVKVLYPFENQPWEKMINLACKAVNNNIQCYAYQHFPIAKNYITCYPSQTIIKNKLFPYILTSDRQWQQCLAQVNYYKCSILGNFRFHSVMKLASKNQQLNSVQRFDKKTILCACSIQFEDSIEIVLKTYEIINIIEKDYGIQLKVIVNFHPLMCESQVLYIKKLINIKSNMFEYSTDKADDILNNCFLVFYNSSSICFNAAYMGIPSVYISSNYQINLDRIPEASIFADSLKLLSQKIVELCSKIHVYNIESQRFKEFFKSYYIEPQFSTIEKLLARKG